MVQPDILENASFVAHFRFYDLTLRDQGRLTRRLSAAIIVCYTVDQHERAVSETNLSPAAFMTQRGPRWLIYIPSNRLQFETESDVG